MTQNESSKETSSDYHTPLSRGERYYFSYGSLVDRDTMASICPDATAVCRARLEGYERKYRDNLTLIEASGNQILGALYRISADCEATLDRAEGFPGGCRKAEVAVHTPDGEVVPAFVYLLDDGPSIPPSEEYLQRCLRGAREWGIGENEFLDPLARDEE
ncbi:MAG: gamma-glutamylcyclotransferase family protein [Bacillota bacterium]